MLSGHCSLGVTDEDMGLLRLTGFVDVPGWLAAGTCCDYCGKGIRNVFLLTDGKRQVVLGSECVKKAAGVQRKVFVDGMYENVPKKYHGRITDASDDNLPF
ncbi:hypothetical protein [Bacillus sp. NEAU-Y102]